jgi:hypothetical protein
LPSALVVRFTVLGAILLLAASGPLIAAERFEGQYYHGEGDIEYLQLLDIARRQFEPDPEFQNMPMLYTPAWNGLVEGPTWGAWWIQNSYGPTYCALPFWQEPFVTFLQNSQDLWFDQMGDGKHKGDRGHVAPDGSLCDAAAPGVIIYKQGDGRVEIHDWGMEFTAAGLVLQAEAVLVSRDPKALAHYLPKLERCANFIESRRDPQKNLFLAGPAGNLLAPSYAGWKRPDGTYDKAYLTGLSITYIAGLDRLIELEKMAGNADKAILYGQRRDLARKGLALVTTDEGYFIKSLDPDGTKHGVYKAKEHGYFEAVPNHDAICFRVVDDAQAEQIYSKIASIRGLRRHDLIITNDPSLDDMYEKPVGLWQFGRWVNGGHWSTCEARMIMAYFRLGKYEDARKSMKRMLDYARRFRMDNPLVDFGGNVYQPNEPINCVYDNWGVPAAMIRGLFEYLYQADQLVILPHIPPRITELVQRFPIRFGQKRLYLATSGSGPITAVTLSGEAWKDFDARSVTLPYDKLPREASIRICLGGAPVKPVPAVQPDEDLPPPATIDWKKLGVELFPVISTNELPLRIGADSNGENRFLGEIGPCRIFSRALKPEEIAALAQDRLGPLDKDPALVACWKFDEAKQGAFANAVGDFLPAKIIGEVKAVDGPQGKAVRLTGRGFLEVADDPRLKLSARCTLAAWVRPGKLGPGGGRILDKCRVGTANGYLIDTFPGGALRMIVEWGAPSCDARLPAGQWSHVAGTVDADGAMALYVNGKQVAAAKPQSGPPEIATLDARVARIRRFYRQLVAAEKAECYEAAHARLAVRYLATCQKRLEMLAEGKLGRLPPPSQYAADRSYFSTAARLCEGLEKTLDSYAKSADAGKKQIHRLWVGTKE